jgi:SAM-dependent methyltransferase
VVRSYTTDSQGLWRLTQTGWRQFAALRRRQRNIESHIAGTLRQQDAFFARSEAMTDLPLRGVKALEIGHGQMPMAAAFLATRGNEVHGVDLDVLPSGLWDLPGYFALARTNGMSRALKTAAREVMGINRAMRAEFVRQAGLRTWPRLHLRQGSATRLPFPSGSFDFAYSFHVLEHIDDPALAVDEAVRVLRPGGALFFVFPHYAQANALHDMRWITGAPGAPLPWAHLIPDLAATVQQGAFVNTLRLSEWKALFADRCPGVRFDTTPIAPAEIHDHLPRHRAQGWLAGFSDEELLTDDLVVAWRKP